MSADYTVAMDEAIRLLSPDQITPPIAKMREFAAMALQGSGNVLIVLKIKTKTNEK